MKQLLFFLCILFLTKADAQAPQKISYQAVIRNTSNLLVTSANVNMKISILQGNPTGTLVYVETQLLTSNINGLVTFNIGTGTVVSGTFTSINWANSPYFIKTETDPNGGTNYSITGITELTSVPYSLFSATSSSTNSGFVHYIGELFQGGIVVYLWKAAGIEHGLIASLSDLSSSQIWSNDSSTLIGTSAQSMWDGQSNSAAIINQPGHVQSAALLCTSYNAGGYTDWYLPAIWELTRFNDAAFIVNETLGDVDGFKAGYNLLYSSSTEIPGTGSAHWSQTFYFSSSSTGGKAQTNHVRAVRKF